MADKDNPRNERDLKTDLFPGDEVKFGGKVKDDGLPGKFTTPEPTEKQGAEQRAKSEAKINSSLSWGKIVNDPEVLTSTNRIIVVTHLNDLLDGLWARYESNTSQFPTSAELERLTVVVTILARMDGKIKTDLGDLLSAMERIENRLSKVGLIAFADTLRDKLLKVPLSPLSVVHQALLKCAAPEKTHRQILREVKLVLIGNANHDAKEFPWEKAFAATEGLVFASGKLSETDFAPSDPLTEKQRRRLGYLALMDLRRQQLEWEKHYLARITPSFNWLYLLQRQTDYEQLAQVYCTDLWSPSEVKEWLEQEDNRARRRKSYQKFNPKKPEKAVVATPIKSSKNRQK